MPLPFTVHRIKNRLFHKSYKMWPYLPMQTFILVSQSTMMFSIFPPLFLSCWLDPTSLLRSDENWILLWPLPSAPEGWVFQFLLWDPAVACPASTSFMVSMLWQDFLLASLFSTQQRNSLRAENMYFLLCAFSTPARALGQRKSTVCIY